MSLAAIERRLANLKGINDGRCPHCKALAGLSESDLDLRIAHLLGKSPARFFVLPEPSRTCPDCHKYDGRPEELYARLNRLKRIIIEAQEDDSS